MHSSLMVQHGSFSYNSNVIDSETKIKCFQPVQPGFILNRVFWLSRLYINDLMLGSLSVSSMLVTDVGDKYQMLMT